MSKNRLTKTLLASFVTISFGATSLGVIGAAVAVAATPNYQVQQLRTGSLFDTSAFGEATVRIDLTSGNGVAAHASTWNPVQVKAPVGQTIPHQVWPVAQPVVASSPVSAPVLQSTANQGTMPGMTADEQQAFGLLNADRAANGLSPLRVSQQLNSLAGNYAQDMISRNFFSHNNPEGKNPFDRMRQNGISYGYAGENLAINVTVPSAEKAFMNSPGHRANILNTHYTQVGVGVRHSSNGAVYVVQEFTDG